MLTTPLPSPLFNVTRSLLLLFGHLYLSHIWQGLLSRRNYFTLATIISLHIHLLWSRESRKTKKESPWSENIKPSSSMKIIHWKKKVKSVEYDNLGSTTQTTWWNSSFYVQTKLIIKFQLQKVIKCPSLTSTFPYFTIIMATKSCFLGSLAHNYMWRGSKFVSSSGFRSLCWQYMKMCPYYWKNKDIERERWPNLKLGSLAKNFTMY